MRSGEPVQFRADSFNILNLVIRYWKVLVIAAFLAALAAAAFTYTITPLFRSAVVLYPTTNVVESQTLFGIQGGGTPLFGDEIATEKVLQILKSDMIKDYLVGKYNLMEHYGINPASRYRYSMLDGKMQKYIVARKTQYNSVEISVLDHDPQVAAGMANDIASQIDTVFNSIVQDAGRKSWEALNNSYKVQLGRVQLLEDSISRSRRPGADQQLIVNLRAGSGRNSWAASAGIYDPGFLKLMNIYESENENLSSISAKLTEAAMLGWQELPYTHIINKARVSERKAFPKRSTIVLATAISVFLLMIFILGLKESIAGNGKNS
jgi:uncharacterized protein involved in exopolysaccharide biosynthesis